MDNLESVMTICRAYRDMGSSVHDQLDSLLEGSTDPDDYNPNALSHYIVPFLEDLANELDESDEKILEEITDLISLAEKMAAGVSEDDDEDFPEPKEVDED